MFNFRRHKNKAGFSLVEIITVLLVISIGMAGTLALITQSVQGQNLNKNTLVAYQLAQEGVELIRFVRDNNWRKAQSWDTSLSDGNYYMDYTNDAPTLMPSLTFNGRLSAGRLVLDDATGFYISSPTGVALPENQYSRVISLAKDSVNPQKMNIKIGVYWYDRGRLNSYLLETDLYDWR